MSGLARLTGSAVAGLAAAAAFPPWGQIWLLPFGLAGLMVTVRGCRGRGGFAQGLAFGLGFMLPLTSWLTVIGADAWLAVGLLEALFYGLMAMTWAWLRISAYWPIGIACTWVGAELLRATVPFGGLPWGRLAFGLVDTPLVHYGRIGGTALVALVSVLSVALAVAVIERRQLDLRAGAMLLSGVGALGVSLLLPARAADPGQAITVATVQGNVPGEGMNAFAERRAVLRNHAQATRAFSRDVAESSRPAPDILIWPENSTDIDPFVDSSAYAQIDRAVQAIGVPTLVGAVVAGPDATQVQNMGIVWTPGSGPGERYVKRHPVPFGEYIPFRGILTRYISRLEQIPRDFARGTFDNVLDMAGTRVGDVICFEVAYDGLIRDAVNDGGELLVVQTNNATYTGTGQLQQQFAISRYRAIETGRTVVVSATNGISGIISPDGEVMDITAEKTRDVLVEEVTLASGVTAGVRIGKWLELALSMAGLALAAHAYLGRRREVGTMAT